MMDSLLDRMNINMVMPANDEINAVLHTKRMEIQLCLTGVPMVPLSPCRLMEGHDFPCFIGCGKVADKPCILCGGRIIRNILIHDHDMDRAVIHRIVVILSPRLRSGRQS